MLGIIEKEITAFSIMDKIGKEYPTLDLYYATNDSEEMIQEFIKRHCKIIILPKVEKKLQNKYPDIVFLDFEFPMSEEYYPLANEELLKTIEEGDQKKVQSILKSLTISEDKIIVLNNPKLRWIKDEIKSVFSNDIVDTLDIILEKIEKIRKEKNLSFEGTGVRDKIIG